MPTALSAQDQAEIVRLARAAIAAAVSGRPGPAVNPATLSPALRRPAAAFVTLQSAGQLRGCIGGLEPNWPLYEDVCRHAAQAATEDFRFEPIRPEELAGLEVEVSVLSELARLDYRSTDDLLARLRPGVDGVTLALGPRRATFLPQVWERVPEPQVFLGMLCEKMGLPADAWRRSRLEVFTYQVETIESPAPHGPAQTDQREPSGSSL